MTSEYSLTVVIDKIYEYQLALEAALMELVHLTQQQRHEIAGENACDALKRIGEDSSLIKQGLAHLRTIHKEKAVRRKPTFS
ncbi:hypothetical protein [Pseudomonas sp. TNT2022 ID642]|uniref:hypothetical protein n=1 Tax=Pseudomonas sp. TNT2022 ID642 TaxID=2942632 RepID=UPI00235FED95|nr:hypothetical protein [Pseudomonas sp. TNT2022 ID642]MDD1002134.1 hypothetical protein [Pseudomonas sp. TNT2022 ID642]